MNKERYFEDLEDIVVDTIYIGNGESDLRQETKTNMWAIGMSQELAEEVTIEDFVNFFARVVENRQSQVNRSMTGHGMIYYLWFDVMANQLRFNLISDLHKELPFGCSIQIAEDEREIISAFLHSPFHNGLPIEGYSDNSEVTECVLKVYKLHLTKQ